jgi:hypothetical protein
VIHAHSSKAGALARALVCLGVKQPVFYTPHAYYGLSGKGGVKALVFNAVETVLGRIGTTINLSEGERVFAKDALKIPQALLRLIANPVDCARFRPADAQKKREIRAALGMILTSRYEGLSFAALEALACNLPVILSRVPGNNDFTEMGLSHCWSAAKEDVDGFADVIGQWARDCGLGRLSNHRQIAEGKFSQDACFGALEREYERHAA